MRYAIDNGMGGAAQSLAATFKTILSLTALTGATTLRRGMIYEASLGADAVPNATDCPITGKIDRQTDVGTATAIAAAPLDVNDAAALLTENANNTAEPTVTAATVLLGWSINQRAAFLWQAAPGSELIIPAVTTTGLGLRAKSPNYASTVFGHLKFIE